MSDRLQATEVYLSDSMDECDDCGESMGGQAVNIKVGIVLIQLCLECACGIHRCLGEVLDDTGVFHDVVRRALLSRGLEVVSKEE